MRDLEIRGAGNLLGTQQSGHIAAVGYELYCRLLENAVRGLKALPPAEPPAVAVDLPGEAWLPREYIPEFRTKIDIYRRISRATADGQLDDIAAELADRFGPLPLEASRLIEFARLRVAAAELGIDSISRHPGLVVFGHHKPRGVERLRDACRRHGRSLRLVGAATAVLPVSPDVAASPDRLFQEVQTVLRAGVASTYKPPSRSVRA
jgi:transcription-repair coupling factor (superfamily II helicase)